MSIARSDPKKKEKRKEGTEREREGGKDGRKKGRKPHLSIGSTVYIRTKYHSMICTCEKCWSRLLTERKLGPGRQLKPRAKPGVKTIALGSLSTTHTPVIPAAKHHVHL